VNLPCVCLFDDKKDLRRSVAGLERMVEENLKLAAVYSWPGWR